MLLQKKLIVISLGVLVCIGDQLHADEVETLRAQNATLVKTVSDLRAEIKALQEKVNNLATANTALTDELNRMREAKQQATVQAAKENAQLQKKLAEAKASGDELIARRVKVYSKFDEEKNRASLSSDYYLLDLGGPLRSKHAFRVVYEHAGKSPPAKPGDAALHIAAKDTAGFYAHVKSAIVTVDGKAFTCLKTDYDSNRKRSTGRRSTTSYDEDATFALSPAVMQAVAAGSKVNLKIGRVDVDLTGEQAAGFAAIHRRMHASP